MSDQKEKAAFICVKDTIDGAYPSLVLGINAAEIPAAFGLIFKHAFTPVAATGGFAGAAVWAALIE